MLADSSARIRLQAFEYLRGQMALHGEVLDRSLLVKGFECDGEIVHLISPQQGIFKPRQLEDAPLSILTTPERDGRERPYDDRIDDDGCLVYRYRGTDREHPDNRGLRRARAERIPLVYFKGIVPGRYMPALPAFIVDEIPGELAFRVQIDDPHVLALPGNVAALEPSEDRRAYITRTTLVRMHQQGFRERVITAYRRECAVCSLKHVELLDAAHIIPDKDPRGVAIVPNGLALCKLHHAAFDQYILGIRPDRVIEINAGVLEEIDGPMLKHGLQGFHNKQIQVPRSAAQRPRQEFLEARYEMFRRSA
jgi:putative restriction endonuclease